MTDPHDRKPLKLTVSADAPASDDLREHATQLRDLVLLDMLHLDRAVAALGRFLDRHPRFTSAVERLPDPIGWLRRHLAGT